MIVLAFFVLMASIFGAADLLARGHVIDAALIFLTGTMGAFLLAQAGFRHLRSLR